jgi:hypothetical protein
MVRDRWSATPDQTLGLGERPMWWEILIVFLILQVVLGILVGRYIKLGNPSAEQPTVWRKKARDRLGRLARFFTSS